MNKRPLLMIGILAVGVGVATILVKTAPKPQKKIQQDVAPLVQVTPIEAADYRAKWVSGASVNANASVNLVAQVTGQVTHIHPKALPGEFAKKGTVLAQIDRRNYQLQVKQKQAALTQAKANLDVEQGQVQKALADYRLSGMQLRKEAKSLALREPQLASAKAAVAIAQAELDKAQLDLTRTQLTMPFDGFIMSHGLNEGAYVNSSTTAFTLIKSDEFWLEVKIPQSFVQVLDQSHPVVLNKAGSNKTRQAQILSVLPQVDANDRQIRVLVAIENPLQPMDQQPIIRYNDYVSVTLFARKFENALRVSTDQLAGGNQIWVVDQNLTLQQRAVNVLYSGRENSWVEIDLENGDQLLLTGLASVRNGMNVRLDKTQNTSVATEEAL